MSEVASIKLVSGAAYIYREQQERYLPIKFSVRERDLGSAIKEAQDKAGGTGPASVGIAHGNAGEFAIFRTPFAGCLSWCQSAWR